MSGRRTTTGHHPAGMALLERRTLRLIQVNPLLCQLTGRTTDELLECNLLELFVDGPESPSVKTLRECARSKRAVAVRLAKKGTDGLRVQLRFRMEKASGNRQLYAVFRPIDTLSEESYEQLVRGGVEAGSHGDSEEEPSQDSFADDEDSDGDSDGDGDEGDDALRAKLAKREKLIQSLSHELRTPLASICSFAELLVDRKNADRETKEEFAEIILRESERMARLLDDLLDLGQAKRERLEMNPKEFDVRDVASDARDAARGIADDRGIEIRGSFGSTPRWVYGDREKLQQVLLNLLTNAVKFSPEDSVVEFRVRPGSQKDRVEISVSDAGDGIPADEREHIFEPFHRLEGESSSTSGAGIGLALCREFVRLHGGLIWVEGSQSGGSTFRVELPGLEEARQLMEDRRTRREEAERKEQERKAAQKKKRTEPGTADRGSASSLPPLSGTSAFGDALRPPSSGGSRESLPGLRPSSTVGLRPGSLPPLGETGQISGEPLDPKRKRGRGDTSALPPLGDR